MKKGLAVLLSVLLLIGMTAVGVNAEGDEALAEQEAGFTEVSRTQTDGTKVQVTCTMPEGALPDDGIAECIIGGEVCTIITEDGETLTLLLDTVPAGLYTRITYGYTFEGQQRSAVVEGAPIVAAGSLAVTLEASINDDGTLTVTATDANDMPAREYQVKLTLEGMPEEGVTNSKGVYTSTYRVSEGKDATFEGIETDYRGMSLVYEAVEKQTITRPSPTTTTVATTTVSTEEATTTSEEATTTTTEATTTATTTTTTTTTKTTTTTGKDATTTVAEQADAPTATTASTTATVKGDSTTNQSGGMIAANALTDTALLEAFGLTRQEFLSKARLLVSEEDYESLVGRTGNTPMLSVRTATEEVTASMIQVALTNVSEFSGYAEEQRQVLTFDLSLVMLSRTGKEVPLTVTPDVLYTIQLPIPTEMKKCAAFAITVMDGDELMTPQVLEVKNGMFELQINSLEAYTLIGFGEESNNGAGGLSWRLIVLLIAGILLIGGAGVLLYLFVFRKPETVENEEKEEENEDEGDAQESALEDNDTDIFSGRTDMDNTWEPEDN